MKYRNSKKFLISVFIILLLICTGCGQSQNISVNVEVKEENAGQPVDKPETDETNQDGNRTNHSDTQTTSGSDYTDWRELYKQVVEASVNEQSGYGLLYIDDNDIPELYIAMDSEVLGDRLYYIKDEGLAEITISPYGLIYWEYQGVFKDESAREEDCWDTFYKLEDGAVTQIHQGTYSVGANGDEQADSSEKREYRYYWDGQEVSSDDYYKQCKEAEGTGLSTFGYEKFVSKADILEQLNHTSGDSSSGQQLRKTVSGSLNIRRLPKHDSELAGTIENDNEILYYDGLTGQGEGSDGVIHEWFKVRTESGVTGWVRGDLVITEDIIQSADSSLRYMSKIVEGTLNIRSLPQHDSELVGTVEERNERLAYYGEIGTGLGSDGLMHEWYRITTEDGVTGWVRSDLVEEQRG